MVSHYSCKYAAACQPAAVYLANIQAMYISVIKSSMERNDIQWFISAKLAISGNHQTPVIMAAKYHGKLDGLVPENVPLLSNWHIPALRLCPSSPVVANLDPQNTIAASSCQNDHVGGLEYPPPVYRLVKFDPRVRTDSMAQHGNMSWRKNV